MATRLEEIKHHFKLMVRDELKEGWEQKFIEDIEDSFARNGNLSDKQFEKLKEISRRTTDREQGL
jgi:hypothetical protein